MLSLKIRLFICAAPASRLALLRSDVPCAELVTRYTLQTAAMNYTCKKAPSCGTAERGM